MIQNAAFKTASKKMRFASMAHFAMRFSMRDFFVRM